MEQQQDVRQKVEDFFSKRMSSSSGGGNVNPGKMDYLPEHVANVPEELLESSFGCGNPLAFSRIEGGATVLDLGSGAGLDLILAAERVGPSGKVIGVDMTSDMIERARKNIDQTSHKNIEVRKGIIEVLPVESNSVDWVISNCVINLSPEKGKVFSEIFRVLKPGGHMIVSDIVTDNLPGWIRRSNFLYCNCVSGAVSEDKYLDGIRSAGLVDATVPERLLYEPSQLVVAIEGMLPPFLTGPKCCGKPFVRFITKRVSNQMSNRVWSAKFFARKPILN